ncbi:MAG: UvrD-helicase domain-containing protein [Treponema sp.]|uniref:UvrD-helicase domain-containing protein n=1 Tax=Treponema sp. TaxID=166 RepID=UPI003FA302C4
MTAFDINNRIHPLLDEGLNDEQKKAVLCMQNAVVAAGAGSGKTFVFARRFSHLIVDMGFELDSILALTFTNKAASEMYARIYKTLKTLAPSNGCAQKALEEFHKARIQTMDSYCASVLRSASRIYGIPPDFVTDVQKITEYVSKEALSFALRHRKNPALQELCALSPIDQIARDFFAASILQYSVIAQPFDFDSGLEKQIAIIADTWKRELEVVDENAAPLADLIGDCENAGNELLRGLENNRVASSALCEYMSKLRSPDIGTGEKKELRDTLNAQLTAFFESLYALKRERAAGKKKPFVLSLRSAYAALSACANYILHFDHVMSLIPLLVEFESKVSEWKRVSGILSFADISSLALKILIEQPYIRRAEKERIRCIMIDEFQDNNEQQRDMLFLLAEHTDRNERSVPQAADLCPDKLFFVGDEKQSIYLFRGADVSVFRKLKTDLSGEGASLAKNYRSSPALIAAFNRFFGGFSEQSDTSERSPYSVFLQNESLLPGKDFPLFEAEYTKALAGRAENNDGVLSAPIHFFLLNTKNSSGSENADEGGSAFSDDNEEALSPHENEAVFVAAKIASLIRAGTKPEDIAVLFRSYSRQDLYEKHLRLQGVPYSSETVTGFFSDAPVNDIYYFLRLIVYPQDMHAFAAVLASPFVRLKRKAVLACIESVRRMPHKNLSVLFCEQAGSVLQGDDAVRFNAGLELYERIRAKTSQSCTDIIDELWYSQGYRYETLCRPDGALFAELYDYLYELARSADACGKKTGGFVESLAELAVNQDKLQDTDIPLERSGSVRLMSIHKSKGLEFPIVFICSASSPGRGTVNTDKLYVDKDGGISFNFPPIHGIPECSKNIFFDSETEILKQKAEAELRRLLYVAFTRAEREVYVSASYALNKDAQTVLEALLNEHSEYAGDEDFLLRSELEALFAQRSESAQSKENRVSVTAPEFCNPNDTFFAFLLPVIVSLCSDLKSRPHKLPFTLARIPLMSREDIFKLTDKKAGKKTSENQKHTAESIAALKAVYEKIPGIQTPVLESLYRSPSQLSPAFSDSSSGEDTASGTILGGGHSPHPACSNIPLFAGSFPLDAREGASYSEVDDIVHSFSNGEFAYNHFGTIAHAFAEAAFTGHEPKVPPETVYALNETQKKTVFAAAKKMADAFINSDLGQQAQNAVWRKNEYSFKLRVPASAAAQNFTDSENDSTYIILNGQIDLIFENDDGIVTVVDFKTDAHEKPSDYVFQLAAYRRAGSVIRNKEISQVKTYVYYLRSGNTADITEQTEQADLNAAVFKGNSNK